MAGQCHPPTAQAFGAHQLKFGVDFERESYHQEVLRHDYQVLRARISVARMSLSPAIPSSSGATSKGRST